MADDRGLLPSPPQFNLSGKDWFTEPEAAFYCGVSVGHFSKHYAKLGINPRRFMGKKLYSRLELSQVIDNSDPWHCEPVYISATMYPSAGMREAMDRLAAYEQKHRGRLAGKHRKP